MKYFLGGRKFGPLTIGASLFATAIAGTFVSQATYELGGTGTWNGLLAAIAAVFLGVFFAPAYIKAQVFTFPQFLSLRFDDQTALVWSGFTILYYAAVKLPLLLGVASWSVVTVLGWGGEGSIALIVVIALIGLYTVAGGYATVIHMQAIQAGIVLVCSFGFLVMLLAFPAASTLSVGAATPPGSVGSTASMSVLILMPFVVAWHWLADQYVLQRIFSARSIDAARNGSLFAALLIVLEIFVIVAAGILVVNGGLVDVLLGSPTMRALAGVFFLALVMASLASDFHSTATLFTLDFYRAANPSARDESMVLVGRLSTTAVVVFAISIVSTSSLLDSHVSLLLRQIEMYAAPPIVAVFLFGLLWKRTASKGMLWGLAFGELFGALILMSRENLSDKMFVGFADLNPLACGFISLVISSVILVGVSLLPVVPSAEGKPQREWYYRG